MPLANTRARYGSVSKLLHWGMALAILAMFPLGVVATDMAEALLSADPFPGEAYVNRLVLLFSLHKTLGVLILGAALVRVVWAVLQPRPGLLNPGNRAEAFAARLVHALLYGAMVIVPLSGWLHHAATEGFAPLFLPFGDRLPMVPKDPDLAAWFSNLHHVTGWVLAGALVLHVMGALKHHFVYRDKTLARMWPGTDAAPEPPLSGSGRAPLLTAGLLWACVLAFAAASAP